MPSPPASPSPPPPTDDSDFNYSPSPTPTPPPAPLGSLSTKRRETTVYDALCGRAKRGGPLAPDDPDVRRLQRPRVVADAVLGRRLRAPEEGIPFPDEDDRRYLPNSDLVMAVHEYVSLRAGERGMDEMYKSMDETALLAMAILLEESIHASLGREGEWVFGDWDELYEEWRRKKRAFRKKREKERKRRETQGDAADQEGELHQVNDGDDAGDAHVEDDMEGRSSRKRSKRKDRKRKTSSRENGDGQEGSRDSGKKKRKRSRPRRNSMLEVGTE